MRPRKAGSVIGRFTEKNKAPEPWDWRKIILLLVEIAIVLGKGGWDNTPHT